MSRITLACGAALVAFAPPVFAPPVFAQASPETQITITATGTRTTLQSTGQQVTVIGEEEIEALQGPDLTRVLERVPALTITRNGGLGGFTGVRLRGSEAEQVLVVVDGVRAADLASPSGSFDFGTLLSLNLEKLEFLRGSNSTIWGSQAIGGVIVAATRAESGFAASAEYGSRDAFAGLLSGGLSDDETGFLGASASYARTDGFSAAEAGTEADGFEQLALDGHGRFYFSPEFEIYARARWAKSEAEIDGTPAPAYALADTLEVQGTRQLFASTGAVYDSGPLFLQGGYSLARTERENTDPAAGPAPTFTSEGRSDRLDLRGEWLVLGPLTAHFGIENEWQSYDTAFDAPASTEIFGTYVQLGIERRTFAVNAGVRVDTHQDFGSAASFGADVSYRLADQWRLRAGIGEGFKAPTLFQLFSDYGNRTLAPEHSTSLDLGIAYGERALVDGPLYGALTLFRRDTSDQIAFVSCFGQSGGICLNRPFGTYDNIGRTRAQGLEAELWARPSDAIALGAVYALIDAEDRTPGAANRGNVLARRPRHAATLTAEWQPLAPVRMAADLRIVSDSYDDAANLVRLDGYELLILRANWQASERVELFGRVENLWDEDYQTAAGYATGGRAAYVGARLAL